MKKITLSLFSHPLMVSSLPAQNSHQLSTERNAYRVPDQLVKQQVEYKDPGSSDKNLTWDFRFLQPFNKECTPTISSIKNNTNNI